MRKLANVSHPSQAKIKTLRKMYRTHARTVYFRLYR